MKVPESITGAYLSGKKQIPVPAKRRKPTGYLKVKGAGENNLKNINVKIPLGGNDLRDRCIRFRKEFSCE